MPININNSGAEPTLFRRQSYSWRELRVRVEVELVRRDHEHSWCEVPSRRHCLERSPRNFQNTGNIPPTPV